MPEYRVSILVLSLNSPRQSGFVICFSEFSKSTKAKEKLYSEPVPVYGCFIFFPVVSTRSFLFVQKPILLSLCADIALFLWLLCRSKHLTSIFLCDLLVFLNCKSFLENNIPVFV